MGKEGEGVLQLVSTAVVEFEFCADEHLACLLGFQLELQPEPICKERRGGGVTREITEIAIGEVLVFFQGRLDDSLSPPSTSGVVRRKSSTSGPTGTLGHQAAWGL